jgi:RNA polymerase sigma-70 factor, ECF subfamily
MEGRRVLFGLPLAWRARRSKLDDIATVEHDDGRLVELARAGDLDAFNELVARHERPVYSVALRYVRSAELAEDVTQDTFLRAYRSLDTFRNEAGFGLRAWLLTIAANRARDLLRAQTRRPTSSLDSGDDDEHAWEPEALGETPLDFAQRGELGAFLERALGGLPPEQRLVVILSDVQGLPYEQIAEIAGVPTGTVKSRLNRGRARMRAMLLENPAARELLGRHARLEGDGERG